MRAWGLGGRLFCKQLTHFFFSVTFYLKFNVFLPIAMCQRTDMSTEFLLSTFSPAVPAKTTRVSHVHTPGKGHARLCGNRELNPFSPLIYTYKFSKLISIYFLKLLKNELRGFDKRSKHFLLSDHFINSHNLISWQCMDIIKGKLKLFYGGNSPDNCRHHPHNIPPVSTWGCSLMCMSSSAVYISTR